ncbi:MAG: sn-glycerol-3-phosphate ABC transporter ATP-binding protein UgpC [Alphaproteobacteria bacterium]|nr:sn-glycerol-3-phosphate ABC transporter ATP-binding protein UgpC [Alphaproteobacteria bacterium]
MAGLQIRNVEKVYGNKFKAVHGISLDVKDGEFMVLVGPSGCAKSTLLRMIAGLETITAGEISIGERVVNNLVPGKRGIAMVFQNYALYPHMKVFKNLSFGMRLQRRPRAEIESGIGHVSRLLEIEELLDRLPKQLSGGQAQRVAVGRAIIKKPEVFLFDEPLSNLDAKLRAAMRVRLTSLHKQLKQEGLSSTVVYVTHDQVEAMTMGDRICVMKDGRIMQVADPVTLYDRPENTFVAGFIGTPEMNLFSARLHKGASGASLEIGKQRMALDPSVMARLTLGDAGEVTAGIRPQHIAPAAAGASNTLEGRVSHVEFMGHEIYLHVVIADNAFIVVTQSAGFDRAKASEGAMHFTVAQDALHLFDPVSGKNISLGS